MWSRSRLFCLEPQPTHFGRSRHWDLGLPEPEPSLWWLRNNAAFCPPKQFVIPCPGSEGAVEEVCDSAGRGQAQPPGQRQRHHPLPVPRQVGRTTRFPGSELKIGSGIAVIFI